MIAIQKCTQAYRNTVFGEEPHVDFYENGRTHQNKKLQIIFIKPFTVSDTIHTLCNADQTCAFPCPCVPAGRKQKFKINRQFHRNGTKRYWQ